MARSGKELAPPTILWGITINGIVRRNHKNKAEVNPRAKATGTAIATRNRKAVMMNMPVAPLPRFARQLPVIRKTWYSVSQNRIGYLGCPNPLNYRARDPKLKAI